MGNGLRDAYLQQLANPAADLAYKRECEFKVIVASLTAAGDFSSELDWVAVFDKAAAILRAQEQYIRTRLDDAAPTSADEAAFFDFRSRKK